MVGFNALTRSRAERKSNEFESYGIRVLRFRSKEYLITFICIILIITLSGLNGLFVDHRVPQKHCVNKNNN